MLNTDRSMDRWTQAGRQIDTLELLVKHDGYSNSGESEDQIIWNKGTAVKAAPMKSALRQCLTIYKAGLSASLLRREMIPVGEIIITRSYLQSLEQYVQKTDGSSKQAWIQPPWSSFTLLSWLSCRHTPPPFTLAQMHQLMVWHTSQKQKGITQLSCPPGPKSCSQFDEVRVTKTCTDLVDLKPAGPHALHQQHSLTATLEVAWAHMCRCGGQQLDSHPSKIFDFFIYLK